MRHPPLLFHRQNAQSGWPDPRSATASVRFDVRTAKRTMVDR